eukprot:scaffold276438_cov37-Prasinocladus_malaysianus.AAC.2
MPAGGFGAAAQPAQGPADLDPIENSSEEQAVITIDDSPMKGQPARCTQGNNTIPSLQVKACLESSGISIAFDLMNQTRLP